MSSEQDEVLTPGVNRPPMVSYSANREDVLLDRLFPDKKDGIFVDVGAGHPSVGSVTRHFYERGWTGINIEPSLAPFRALADERKRDTNLNIALSNKAGTLNFFELEDEMWGYSTLSSELAERYQNQNIPLKKRSVTVSTLADVFARHLVGDVDFLSIDVEGHEREVLEGGDWKRWRPTVVVVEATRPGTPVPSHDSWEGLLLDAAYIYAAFDGLNRYYIRGEDRTLVSKLSTPVNIFDNFIPYDFHHQIEGMRRASVDLEGHWLAARSLKLDLDTKVESLWNDRSRLEQELSSLARINRDLERQLIDAKEGAEALEGLDPAAVNVARTLQRASFSHPRTTSATIRLARVGFHMARAVKRRLRG